VTLARTGGSEHSEDDDGSGSVSPRLDVLRHTCASPATEVEAQHAGRHETSPSPFDSTSDERESTFSSAAFQADPAPSGRLPTSHGPMHHTSPSLASMQPGKFRQVESDSATLHGTSELLLDAPSFAFQCAHASSCPDGPRSPSQTLSGPFSTSDLPPPPLAHHPSCPFSAPRTCPAVMQHSGELDDPGDSQPLFSFPCTLSRASFSAVLLPTSESDHLPLSRALDHSHSLGGPTYSGDLVRQSPPHAAAAHGDAATLRQLLADSSSPNDLWAEAGTPLHCAVQVNSTDCVAVCLSGGLDADAESGEGITPLMLAAAMGHEEVMLQLLDHGASILKAFLPGSAENLLHFCVEHVRPCGTGVLPCRSHSQSFQSLLCVRPYIPVCPTFCFMSSPSSMQEMVKALKAVLKHPDGVALATSSRMKPIYAALVQMAELAIAQTDPQAPANKAHEKELTKAKSVVDLLIAHSNMPANASYDDLIMQAQASYRIIETTGGSECDEAFECLLSPNQLSTTSPAAHEPDSSCMSSRADSIRRLSFTPTANLDCSPAQCSPISRFCFEPCDSTTPSSMARHCLSALNIGGTPRAVQHEGSSPMVSTVQTSPAVETPIASATLPPILQPTAPGAGAVTKESGARETCLPPLPGLASSPIQTHLRVRTRVRESGAPRVRQGASLTPTVQTPSAGQRES
jgi:hypothetical protein